MKDSLPVLTNWVELLIGLENNGMVTSLYSLDHQTVKTYKNYQVRLKIKLTSQKFLCYALPSKELLLSIGFVFIDQYPSLGNYSFLKNLCQVQLALNL